MKKISTWNFATIILVALTFLATEKTVSQTNGERLFASSSIKQKNMAEHIRSILNTHMIYSDSVSIPPVEVLQEPAFTAGDSNMLFWNPISDPVTFALDGQDIDVSRDSCFVVIYLYPHMADDQDSVVIVPAEQNSVNIRFTKSEWLDTRIDYAFYLGAAYEGVFYIDSLATTYMSSYQDITPPAVDSVKVIGPGQNGWIASSQVTIRYFGLQDTAALYSAFLSGDIDITDSTLFNGDPINPQPSWIESGIFEISLADNIYDFNFGACDAAFSARSRGEPNAVWERASNCDETLISGTARIDTQPPVIDLSLVDPPYFPNNNKIEILLSDALSGVDTSSLAISFDPSLPSNYDIELDQTDDTWRLAIVLGNLNADMTSTLSISVSDSAGNRVMPPQQTEIELYFSAPQIASFRMVDLDFDAGICLNPDSSYTNSTIVLLDSIEFVDKIADSLLIIGDDDSVVVPYESRIEFDIRDVTFNIQSPENLILTIKGKDSFGNVEPTGTSQNIRFNDNISPISLIVQDFTSIDDDLRRGAYPGWTNDSTVLNTILPVGPGPDPDLYAIERLAPELPQPNCFDAGTLTFNYTFPQLINKIWSFQYAVSDSAGNVATSEVVEIELDTSIYQPVAADYMISDTPGSLETVDIKFLHPDSVPDLSRFVVNDIVYRGFTNATVTVPANSMGYTISLVDSAGNECEPDSPPLPCPIFEFALFDTSDFPNDAETGFTNETVIEWDFDSSNFNEAKLESMTFFDSTGTDSVEWLASPTKRLDLRDIYSNLQSNTAYKVLAKAYVTNWPQCDKGEPLPSFAIIYDDTKPEIADLELDDRKLNAWPADAGFTNDYDVDLYTSLQLPASDDVINMSILGDVDSVWIGDSWQTPPEKFEYAELHRISLSKGPSPERKDVQMRVQDRAGNWSEPAAETSILYLNQLITNHTPAQDTIKESDIDENGFATIPIGFSSPSPEYIKEVATVNLDAPDDTLWTKIDMDSCEQRSDQHVCDVRFKLSDDAQFNVIFVDVAGNGSDAKTIDIDVQIPPDIELTLFDYATFPEFASPTSEIPADTSGVDDKYTDESEPRLLVALTEKVRGDWSFIRYSFDPNVDWSTVRTDTIENDSANIYLRTIEKPQTLDPMDDIICYFQVENSIGDTAVASASIIYDSVAPTLDSFSEASIGENDAFDIVSDSLNYQVTYSGSDNAGGQLAGLIVSEYVLNANNDTTNSRHTFIKHDPALMTKTIRLLADEGRRILSAVLVDRADVDYFRPEEIQTQLNNNDWSSINHPSKSKSFEVRLNKMEVSNYPNPFNPSSHDDNMRKTKLLFHIKEKSMVRITILDPFGNLVNEWEAPDCNEGLNDGYSNDKLVWDGTNAKGDIVANGGYICIIDALATGERHMRKIAVIKD